MKVAFRIMLIALVFVAAVFLFVTQPIEANGLVGDVNGDGKVDMEDVYLANDAFGSYPGHPRWNSAADINQDNVVNIKDIRQIIANFFHIEFHIPELPFGTIAASASMAFALATYLVASRRRKGL